MTILSPRLPTYLSSMPLGSLQTRSTPRTSTSRSGIPSLDAWIPSSQSLKISPLLTSGSSSLPPTTTTTTLVLRKARRRLVQPRVLPHLRCQYIVERRTPPLRSPRKERNRKVHFNACHRWWVGVPRHFVQTCPTRDDGRGRFRPQD